MSDDIEVLLVRLPRGLTARVRKAAKSDDRTISAFVKRALEASVSKMEADGE